MAISMVQNYQQFIRSEVFAINFHIAARRALGDNRPENDIAIEWIEKNAESFRNNFVLAHR